MTPSINQGGGADRDRIRFDDPDADEGARWLDRDIFDARPQVNKDRKLQLAALIRGMDKISRVRAWKAAEKQISKERCRDPRSWVMDRLEAREATLEEIGERPDRLTHGPRQSHQEWQAGDPPKTAAEVRASGAELATVDGDQLTQDAFATDGGEPEDGD